MPQVEHPLISPEKIGRDNLTDSVTERVRKTGDILSLTKEEYKESMEEKLAALIKEVPAFKVIADSIIDTKEKFWISAITAKVIDRKRHMVAELSSNLGENPVFVTPVNYDEVDKEYIYNLFVPASEEILDESGRSLNEIPVKQLKIIKDTFNNLSEEWRVNLKHITLNREVPAPMVKVFRRSGTWTVWKVKMNCLDDFWSHYMSQSIYSHKQPFLATPNYEFAMLVSDDAYKEQFEEMKENMVRHAKAKEIHTIEFDKEESIEVSYAWLLGFLGRDEMKRKEKEIHLLLKRWAPRFGSGIPKAIIGEDEPKYNNIGRMIDESTAIRYPGFRYANETYERCILKNTDFK